MPKKITTKDFINRAIKVHGDKYDYLVVNYKTLQSKVIIICSVHGKFEQRAKNHLDGQGCPKCANVIQTKNQKLPTKKFIERAIKIHNNIYDYSKTNYINNYTNIIIICKKHGEFEQQPKTHIYQKSGCPKCKKLKQLNTKEFIKRSNKIHNNKYDYSLTIYTNQRNNVKVICPIHGMFEQKAENHMQGRGCHKCSIKTSSPELEIHKFLNNNKILFKKTDRSIIKPYELDIIIPSMRLAIEFNGRYWHSDEMILKRTNGKMNAQQYHQMKTDMCNKKGYHLHHIDEQDWIDNKQKELDKIYKLLL